MTRAIDLDAAWLLNWLLDGALLALLVCLLMRVLRIRRASSRYLVWCAASVALIAMPWLLARGSDGGSAARDNAPGLASRPLVELPDPPEWVIPAVLLAWILIMVVRLTAVLRALRSIAALKGTCRRLPARRAGELALWRAARGEGRRVRLRMSDRVTSASALGLTRPVIAIAPALLEALTDRELDQVVLHEYGHLRRRDDWTRLGQATLEAICGFHPAFVWMSGALNLEREMACDEWVASRTGNAKAYAACLAKVASLRCAPSRLRLAPGLLTSRSGLSRRIENLIDANGPPRHPRLVPGFITAVLLVGSVLTMLGHLPPMLATRPAGPMDDAVATVVPQPPAQRAPLSRMPELLAARDLPHGSAPAVRRDVERVRAARPRLRLVEHAKPAGPPVIASSSDTLAESRPILPTIPMTARLVQQPQAPGARPEVDPASDRAGPDGTSAEPPALNSAPLPALPSQWRAMAEAGRAVGTGAGRAGTETAAFFTKMSGSMARAFSGKSRDPNGRQP